MRYALLVCIDESVELSEADAERRFAEFSVFQDDLRSRGVLLARERLRPTSLATTVSTRGGDLVVADGPFAETKEQIAGFYIIECADLDDAIDIASRNPAAAYGTIEVRPVWEI
ncbi:MAG: YciI family protein [Actinomycetota bacterium]|nr:YciI family protein [Actinomycetota bacterium]